MDPLPWVKWLVPLLSKLRWKKKVPPPIRPILLVEDNAEDAFLALRTIHGAGGYICDWTESGEHALILMSKSSYRMVIIDIGLRGMDGWELVKKIRRENPTMPLWLYTGTSDNLFCVEPGIPVGLLLKSMRQEALLDAIAMTAP